MVILCNFPRISAERVRGGGGEGGGRKVAFPLTFSPNLTQGWGRSKTERERVMAWGHSISSSTMLANGVVGMEVDGQWNGKVGEGVGVGEANGATDGPRFEVWSSKSRPFCTECEDTRATVYCEACEEDYCSLCWAFLHRKGARARHTTRAISTVDAAPPPEVSGWLAGVWPSAGDGAEGDKKDVGSTRYQGGESCVDGLRKSVANGNLHLTLNHNLTHESEGIKGKETSNNTDHNNLQIFGGTNGSCARGGLDVAMNGKGGVKRKCVTTESTILDNGNDPRAKANEGAIRDSEDGNLEGKTTASAGKRVSHGNGRDAGNGNGSGTGERSALGAGRGLNGEKSKERSHANMNGCPENHGKAAPVVATVGEQSKGGEEVGVGGRPLDQFGPLCPSGRFYSKAVSENLPSKRARTGKVEKGTHAGANGTGGCSRSVGFASHPIHLTAAMPTGGDDDRRRKIVDRSGDVAAVNGGARGHGDVGANCSAGAGAVSTDSDKAGGTLLIGKGNQNGKFSCIGKGDENSRNGKGIGACEGVEAVEVPLGPVRMPSKEEAAALVDLGSKAAVIPLRLEEQERGLLSVLLGGLHHVEYTSNVDVVTRGGHGRLHMCIVGLKDMFKSLWGMFKASGAEAPPLAPQTGTDRALTAVASGVGGGGANAKINGFNPKVQVQGDMGSWQPGRSFFPSSVQRRPRGRGGRFIVNGGR
ncbi:unnamed protein product, partial [Choristocarpus tenellus]